MACLALHSLIRKLVTVGYNSYFFCRCVSEQCHQTQRFALQPGVSCLLGRSTLSLASVVVTSSDGAHSRGSLVTPAGRLPYLVGSKRKLIPMRNGFGVGKSRKLDRLGCLGGGDRQRRPCVWTKHLAMKRTLTSFQGT